MTGAGGLPIRRLGTPLLVGLIFLGSLALVALPVAWIWLAAHIGGTYSTIFWLSLLGCPAAILAGAIGLSRLNRLYLKIATGYPDKLQHGLLKRRSSLETTLVIAVLLAAALLALWIIFLAGQGTNQYGPFPD